MQAFRTETTLSQNGKLSLKGLPFRKGDQVEIIILTQKHKETQEHYPLRQKPITYHKPFEGVAEEEWGALK